MQVSFPVPPEVLWNSLPAGVAAAGGSAPYYDPQRGTVFFKTGMSLLSWGQNVTVTVSHAPGGSALTVQTTLKLGLIDWGEGKRLGNRFTAAVAHAAGIPALT
ncbi:hypothetical protein DV20_03740 [Amycolatopsis rifamycinica]|uniref:Uncharacterized protein n=1 Tax=Amycolatopsis rifamycinica TaxID=287986 RepID=A0A066UCM2_9PSEU|nr:hypothetical protein DV20_03740 [Amycolatopsis rifamycinica]